MNGLFGLVFSGFVIAVMAMAVVNYRWMNSVYEWQQTQDRAIMQIFEHLKQITEALVTHSKAGDDNGK
jgi:hypothetical protein